LTAPSTTARLPRLQKADAVRPTSTSGEEPLISLYEKGRKTLLLKRREGERELKKMKASLNWKKVVTVHQVVVSVVEEEDNERKRSQSAQGS
jgi:hypothetical protein